MPRTLVVILIIKIAIATAAAGLLLGGWILRRRRRAHVFRRVRDALLAALGIASLAAWWNFGLFHLGHYLHLWDIYHYYVGAKYAPELGYTRLYACAALAEAELGHRGEVARRGFRNLWTNEIESGEVALADSAGCLARFSPPRWESFKHDIAWFRNRIGAERWRGAQLDHGYNPTPVWTMVGTAFSNLGPASDARILLLALIDPVLLLALWGAAVWAFGWRPACVACVFWGTSFGSDFGWTGGTFLRMDWLFLTVLGVALLRKRWPAAAGFALAWATLLRVFPGFLFAGPALGIAVASVRQRRFVFPREDRRLLAGAALAVLVLGSLSTLGTSERTLSLDAWSGFVANSRKHLESLSVNNIGLKTVVSFVHDEPLTVMPGEYMPGKWWEPHRQAIERRRPLFVLLIACFIALLARAAAGRRAWVSTVLSVGLIPVAATLSCYYGAVLLLYGFLWPRKQIAGVSICALSALSGVFALTARWVYENYVLYSLATIVVVTAITAAMACRTRRAPERTRLA